MNISVIIISFASDHMLDKLIKSFPKKFQIVIIENSRNISTKKYIEKKFINTKVIIPTKNLGYAGAVNLGLKNCRNNFVTIATPDIQISIDVMKKFENLLKNFNNFSLISGVYHNQRIHQNYVLKKGEKNTELKIGKLNLREVIDIDGCFLILNKSKFNTEKVFDDNFFMYFENTDLCHRLKLKNKKMYIVNNLKFNHKGTKSTAKRHEIKISENRNWHYSWSKFNYFKKHNSYLYAFKIVMPNLFKASVGYLQALIASDKNLTKTHKATISGIISAITLKKSFFRPDINK